MDNIYKMSEPIEVEHKVIYKSVAISIIIISLTSIYMYSLCSLTLTAYIC